MYWKVRCEFEDGYFYKITSKTQVGCMEKVKDLSEIHGKVVLFKVDLVCK